MCGKQHLARECHSKEEVMTAIDKLKKQNCTKLPTVGDLSAIFAMKSFDEEEDSGVDSDFLPQADDGNCDNNLTQL